MKIEAHFKGVLMHLIVAFNWLFKLLPLNCSALLSFEMPDPSYTSHPFSFILKLALSLPKVSFLMVVESIVTNPLVVGLVIGLSILNWAFK